MADKYQISDDIWEKLIELTDGSAMLCFQCGSCTAACPWGLVKDETISIREMIRKVQLGLTNKTEQLWLCTTCAQCDVYCPRGVDIPAVFRALRSIAWEGNHPAEGLPTMLWSVFWNNNPWEQPPSQRMQWAENLQLPLFDPEKHEILYFVGCMTSYDQRAQKIAKALVKLFRQAGVKFGVLGENEPCSGEEVLSIGHTPYFDEIAQNSMRIFQEKGVTKLVTTSPHSYDAFKNHYPPDENFKPMHYTQYLAKLLEKGKLKLNKSMPQKITFQDPCYLSRHNSESTSPRTVLQALPDAQFIEIKSHDADTLCCGGGGGRMWLETPMQERFANLRIQELQETGADVLATACPYCISCLEDGLKAHNMLDIAVMDVAELAALASESTRDTQED